MEGVISTNFTPEMKVNWLQQVTNLSKASNYSMITNWGPAVSGCQLSIGLHTNIFCLGTVATLNEWIRNSSTNKVWIVSRQPWNLFLTNDFGKKYLINLPPATTVSTPRRGDAYPGEFIVGEGGVIFGGDIVPGSYILQFTRDLETDKGGTFTLTSNPLNIKIIAVAPSPP